MKYDVKLEFLSVNGINFTNHGDTVAEHTKDGNAVDMRKGIKGDAVTMVKYDRIDRIRTTLDPYAPFWGQIESWEKNNTQLSLQFKDNNTGVSRSSTTAYVETVTYPHDGQDGEVTFVCEEVH